MSVIFYLPINTHYLLCKYKWLAQIKRSLFVSKYLFILIYYSPVNNMYYDREFLHLHSDVNYMCNIM